MEHKLRILVRLDMDRCSAVLVVDGCLTMDSYGALLPVVRRVSALVDGLNIVVDLRDATHIDRAAAAALANTTADEYRHHDVGMVTFAYPDIYPECASLSRDPSTRHLAVS